MIHDSIALVTMRLIFLVVCAAALIGLGAAAPPASAPPASAPPASAPETDFDNEPRPGEACGYASCNDAEDGVLNVHIVAHTHDDVGWLKTVDEYYYGSRSDIQKAGVQYILDSVIKELWEDRKRKFIYVETAFFWKWWTLQSDSTRHKVHVLVRQGRLQFVGGAWSMNDEAASHYQSTIDQFTRGLQKLNETFGECATPRVGWQIDPFGHSREFASLLADMGYDGLFLGRIDYEDKSARKEAKTMEMLWRGDDDLGKSSDIFTGVLYNTYSPPAGFCFDVLCSDEPIVDDVLSPIFNVDDRISEFLKYVTEQSQHYRSNNVILTMGGDFTYQDAGMWYKNLDKLIEYTNLKAAKDGLNIKLFYSTPTCYLHAVKNSNPTLPIKQDDFFPYASDPNSYWTGYFTSRPTTKYFERQGNSYLQMLNQLQVTAGLEEHNMFVLDELRNAMGIMQHHDAITGTEKQKVTQDYERILTQAIDGALIVAQQAYNKLMQGDALKPALFNFERCRLNESRCEVSENSRQFVVSVYNHLAWHVNDSVRIPVLDGTYEVYAPNGEKITSQLVDIPSAVQSIPTRVSKATHEIVFIAYLKPLSFKSFYIKRVVNRNKRQTKKHVHYENINDYWKKIKNQPYIDLNLKDAQNAYKTIHRLNKDTYIPDNVYMPDMANKNTHLPDMVSENTYLPDMARKNTHLPDMARKNTYLPDTASENTYVPDVPDVPKTVDNEDSKYVNTAKEVNLEMLKSNKKEQLNSDIEQLEKLIEEAKQEADNYRRKTDRDGYGKMNYPADIASGEELRMLSDEPRVVERPREMYLENQLIKLRIDEASGDITHAVLTDGTQIKLQIQYAYYPGCYGDNREFANRSSGAYIFRPNATSPIYLTANFTQGPIGPVVREYRSQFTDNVASYVRLYDGLNYIESEWVVGPIDVTDGIGKEYIVKYITDIVNNGQFYTDSNGRQVLKRALNKRPQFNVTIVEPVAANYYPVVNKIAISGENGNRIAVLTDRSEGGSSLSEGEVELMLHRRLLHDDAFGVDEALNETAMGKGLVVRGTQRIFLTTGVKHDYVEEKKLVLQYHLQPQVLIANSDHVSFEQWIELTKAHSFANELPSGVHLLSLQPWGDKTLLLRLENYFELADKDSTSVEVDLAGIFKGLTVKSYRETTLSANQWLDEHSKWDWKTEKQFSKSFNDEYGNFNDVEEAKDMKASVDNEDLKVKLSARQIRTFVVNYEFNK